VDIFDSDPYVGLMPKRWRQIAGLIALVALMTLQPVRQWFVSQAEAHATHEIQPIINGLIQKTANEQEPQGHLPPGSKRTR
jgi:hypothetical protein